MQKVFILVFLLFISATTFSQDIMLLKQNGKVVIGDTTQISTPGNYQLYVQNGILTEKVKVSLRNTGEWSDDAWKLKPQLADVDKSIKDNSHLINMPSADSLVKNGYELKSMDAKLLEQIEWLWMHLIDIEKENKLLKKEIAGLKQSAKN